MKDAKKIAAEIERNLMLTPPNSRIYFDDVEWALIVKALRAYPQESEPQTGRE